MAAAWPVRTKMPAPMMQPIPRAIRWRGPKDRLSSTSSFNGFSGTVASTISGPPVSLGTMAERLGPVQPPSAGLTDLAILQLLPGGHLIGGKLYQAGLGKIGAAGIAQQDIGLSLIQPRHQPFRQWPLVAHVADQNQIESLS